MSTNLRLHREKIRRFPRNLRLSWLQYTIVSPAAPQHFEKTHVFYRARKSQHIFAKKIKKFQTQAAKAVEKSAKKAERSTGAGGGGVSAGLTAAQQRELDEWNREFPHLKMTAKDFLER